MNETWVNDWYLIGVISEITPGTVGQRTVGSTALAVFSLEGSVFAVDDRCQHCDGLLSSGVLGERCLECSSCGHSFSIADPADARTGAADALKTYPLMLVDDEIFAWIEDRP